MYVGELLFYPDFRGKGLGTRLLTDIEQHYRSQGSYEFLTCAVVKRSEDHPCRPAGYVPIERFLQKNRFEILPGLRAHFTWQETDGNHRGHEMQFWSKTLAR